MEPGVERTYGPGGADFDAYVVVTVSAVVMVTPL
jgi:hypothetical protein